MFVEEDERCAQGEDLDPVILGEKILKASFCICNSPFSFEVIYVDIERGTGLRLSSRY